MQPMPEKLVLLLLLLLLLYIYILYFFVATGKKTTSGTRVKKGHTLITGKETVEQED